MLSRPGRCILQHPIYSHLHAHMGKVLVGGIVSVLLTAAIFATANAQRTTDPPYGTITGVVFVDLDFDGVRDPGEPGIAGVTVIIRRPGTTFFESTTTDANGEYTFDKLIVGTYTIEETDPPGFASFTSNLLEVTVVDGLTTTTNFADGYRLFLSTITQNFVAVRR